MQQVIYKVNNILVARLVIENPTAIPAFPIQGHLITYSCAHIPISCSNKLALLETAEIIKSVELAGIPFQRRKLKSCFIQISKKMKSTLSQVRSNNSFSIYKNRYWL